MADVAPPAVQLNTTTKATHQTEELPEGAKTGPAPAVEKAGKGKGLRALRDRIALRRPYSTKHASLSSPSLLSPSSEEYAADAQEDASPKRAKVPALERLIGGKLGRGGKKMKDVGAAPVTVTLDPASSGSSASSGAETEQVEQVLATIVEVASSAPQSEADTKPSVGPADTSDPEPLPVARRIQSLLSSLPPFLSFEAPADTPDGERKRDGSNAETPADGPPPIPDSSLLSLLTSPSIMNGSLSRNGQSVWTMLDNLRVKTLKSSADAGTTHASAPAESVLEDDDSVMFYAPLIPDANSSVELARSEIVSVDENGTIMEVIMEDAPLPYAPRPTSQTNAVGIEKFNWHWPFHRSPPASPPPPPNTVQKRVWVPSTEKLSLQVMWWGFRLWLPPPVLAILNDKEIEAAKLAALLTTALQWLLNNVPTTILPPVLRPALALVKSLVPYLGYIGGFVAWSWGALKGFDKGFGVTLTATWLLPIALVPGTWEERDVPKPPATSDPSAPPGGNPAPSDPSAPPANPPPANPPLANPPPADPSPPSTSDPSTSPAPSSPTTDPLPPGAPGIFSIRE